MKLAHIADVHLGRGYPGPTPESRFDDIKRTLEWSAVRIIDAGVDGVLFAGDAFKDAKVYVDRARDEIRAFVYFLTRFTDAGIPVLVISGTPSHDAVAAYDLISDMQLRLVKILTHPGVAHIAGVKVGCLPGMNRSQVATSEEFKGLQPREIHRLMSRKITDIAHGLHAMGAEVLLSHMTYCETDAGFDALLQEHEPVLTNDAVQPFDLVCLGHIHRPDSYRGRVFYSGSVERLSFNDECVHTGFWIHELESLPTGPSKWKSEYIETPSRRFATIEVPQEPDDIFRALIADHERAWNSIIPARALIKDSIVRVRWACTEEQAPALDRKEIERSLYRFGAFHVTEVRIDVERTERRREESVTESLGPIEAVGKWCAANGRDDTERLCDMTRTLIEEGAA